jgi:hypothetical protein
MVFGKVNHDRWKQFIQKHFLQKMFLLPNTQGSCQFFKPLQVKQSNGLKPQWLKCNDIVLQFKSLKAQYLNIESILKPLNIGFIPLQLIKSDFKTYTSMALMAAPNICHACQLPIERFSQPQVQDLEVPSYPKQQSKRWPVFFPKLSGTRCLSITK